MGFVEENIGRLIKQCDGGDEAVSFLAIYSFIEGYFRASYPNAFKWEKDWKFHQILEYVKSRYLGNASLAESKLYERLKRYHGERDSAAYKDLKTFTDTNRIRHCFSNIREGTLSVIVGQFIEFARYRNFLTEEIANMNAIKSVEDSRSKIQLRPSDDSVLYHAKSDLLLRYDSILASRENRSKLKSALEDLDGKMSEETDDSKLLVLARQRKEKLAALERTESEIGRTDEYTNFINELAISLIEAQSKKDYEAKIMRLSESQKKLINEDIDALTEKHGHSMYIKGGPGTGKTLVLIVILFKLYHARRKSVLLTYYPTLNKYINYLFELYNDDKLLNDFSVSKFDQNSLEVLGRTGILKFDDFLLPKIVKLLGIGDTYSASEKRTELVGIFQSVEPDYKKAAKLYDEVINNVLPNMLDEKKYCTSPRKTGHWRKISQVLEMLDNKESMLDLFAYYKFGLEDINQIAFTNESFDYILIDEAQDLTNAQIFAVNKFVSKTGGLILAGDPSQEIRNRRTSMAQLDVDISGGKRYNPELTQNFRSSILIQELGNKYKQEPCLHIRKNTKSVEGLTAGPPPQIFITDDTESSNYQNTYKQILNSVRMCTSELCIVPGNICIVAFNEPELLEIKEKLKKELNIESALIYKDKDFLFKDDTQKSDGKVRLCTVKEIKGIDCAVLLFMITDQSNQNNNGGIVPQLRANAIYTCITRAMYLLQVFVPKYCKKNDLSVAVLVNKLCPQDKEVQDFIDEQNKKKRKGIPLKEYFEKYKDENETEITGKIESDLKDKYKRIFGSDENCSIDFSEDMTEAYIYATKKVVDTVQDELTEISIKEASKIEKGCSIGDEIEVYINPNNLIKDNRAEFKSVANPCPTEDGSLATASGPKVKRTIVIRRKPDVLPQQMSKSENLNASYEGRVLENSPRGITISTENTPYYWLKFLPVLYENEDTNIYSYYEVGDIIKFKIVDNPENSDKKMAKILPMINIFKALEIGQNLKGELLSPFKEISKGSISKGRLAAKGFEITPALIGKSFMVKIIEKNPQGNGWILDVIIPCS